MTSKDILCAKQLDISTNIFMELDFCGRILYINSKGKCVFSGYAGEGTALSDLVEPERKTHWVEIIKNVVYQRYPENLSLVHQGRYYNVSLYPNNHTISVCMEDVSERRQLSHLLHKTKQQLDFTEKSVRLGYWELDWDSRKFYWSEGMYRLFGIKSSNSGSRRNLIRENIVDEDLAIYKRELKRLVTELQPVSGIIRIKKSTGKIIYCEFRAEVTVDFDKEKIVGVLYDVTDYIKSFKKSESDRKNSEKNWYDEKFFITQASHDLRQPMQALQLFINMLANEKLNETQKDLLYRVETSANNVKMMLDDLLLIGKIGGKCKQLNYEKFDIGELIEKLGEEYKFLARNMGKNLLYKAKHKLVFSDKILLERMLRNLLTNAITYTKNKIKLVCESSTTAVIIRIIDNGCGIKSRAKLIGGENCNQVMFKQDRYKSDCELECGGLGLCIVTKIAELLGIKIRLRSKQNNYSAFELIIPL